jgi:hypothetical protein
MINGNGQKGRKENKTRTGLFGSRQRETKEANAEANPKERQAFQARATLGNTWALYRQGKLCWRWNGRIWEPPTRRAHPAGGDEKLISNDDHKLDICARDRRDRKHALSTGAGGWGWCVADLVGDRGRDHVVKICVQMGVRIDEVGNQAADDREITAALPVDFDPERRAEFDLCRKGLAATG